MEYAHRSWYLNKFKNTYSLTFLPTQGMTIKLKNRVTKIQSKNSTPSVLHIETETKNHRGDNTQHHYRMQGYFYRINWLASTSGSKVIKPAWTKIRLTGIVQLKSVGRHYTPVFKWQYQWFLSAQEDTRKYILPYFPCFEVCYYSSEHLLLISPKVQRILCRTLLWTIVVFTVNLCYQQGIGLLQLPQACMVMLLF